jgi:hypothetical protein
MVSGKWIVEAIFLNYPLTIYHFSLPSITPNRTLNARNRYNYFSNIFIKRCIFSQNACGIVFASSICITDAKLDFALKKFIREELF